MEENNLVVCQRWKDKNGFIRISLHLTLEDWRDYVRNYERVTLKEMQFERVEVGWCQVSDLAILRLNKNKRLNKPGTKYQVGHLPTILGFEELTEEEMKILELKE